MRQEAEGGGTGGTGGGVGAGGEGGQGVLMVGPGTSWRHTRGCRMGSWSGWAGAAASAGAWARREEAERTAVLLARREVQRTQQSLREAQEALAAREAELQVLLAAVKKSRLEKWGKGGAGGRQEER